MRVINRYGESKDIEFDEITKKIKTIANQEPILNIDAGLLAKEVIGLVYDGITTSELDRFTASTAANMSLYNSDYELFAGRIIINNHTKNTDDNFSRIMLSLENVSDEIKNLCANYGGFIETFINYDRDYLLSYFGFCTLEKAYLLKKDGKILERPQHLFMRVALGIHGSDFDRAKETYDYLSQKYFTHATPTLFNAGTKFPQMSSCYLIGTEDSVEGIYKTIGDVAMISKWAGGVGIHISNVRADGSEIKKTNGISQGIMPMLKVYNDTARYINQSSKRLGSFAMYLEPWHGDIFTFLEAKKNNGSEEMRARDLFYALWIPDLFMERVKNKGKWSLMCPDKCPGLNDTYGDDFDELYIKYENEGKFIRQIDVMELWNAIINSQIETGGPYMLYKDSINRKSNQKNIGIIKSSNLCCEITEFSNSNETAVCNLASICLPKFVYGRHEFNKPKILMYSKQDCYYCQAAMTILEEYGLEYELDKIDDKHKRIELYEKWSEESNEFVQTMPQIFINDERIGGYDKLCEYIDNCYKIYFDYVELGKVVEIIVENLNLVIDKNYYPTKESQIGNLKHRPIGIGVQGLADVFMMMNEPFCSDNARKINKNIFETIYYHALKKSSKLAEYHGSYSSFYNSPASEGILQFDMWNKKPEFIPETQWNILKEDIQEFGLRNSLLVAPMPTASTAQIMGNNESFEPYTSNMYTRRVLSGEFVCINKHLIKYLKQHNLDNKEIIDKIILDKGSVQKLNIPDKDKEIFKTVWEISQKALLEMAADRGIFIDQSQSFNVFVENADPKIINSIHLYGYKLGLKTGSYYIRTKPILKSQNFSMEYVLEKNKKMEEHDTFEPCISCSS